MTRRIRRSFPSVFAYAAIAIGALVAGMLVDFSPPLRGRVFRDKRDRRRVRENGDQAARPAASPSSELVANYGKLPLGFEPNEGQSDGLVKFLSRGRGYSLFLTGNEAVLTFQKGAIHQPKREIGRSARTAPTAGQRRGTSWSFIFIRAQSKTGKRSGKTWGSEGGSRWSVSFALGGRPREIGCTADASCWRECQRRCGGQGGTAGQE